MPKKTFLNLSKKKREKIINAAYDIFISNEYEDITIRDMASAMDIAIGSFYQYFEDKDDLYIYLISNIEKRVYEKEFKNKHSFFMNTDVIPLEEICNQKEFDFNRTWYRAPVEVMMKFYFGKHSKEINSHVFDELVDLKESNQLKDDINIDFVFHMVSTSMFNIQMYFKDNNITDENLRIKIKREFYTRWFLDVILA